MQEKKERSRKIWQDFCDSPRTELSHLKTTLINIHHLRLVSHVRHSDLYSKLGPSFLAEWNMTHGIYNLSVITTQLKNSHPNLNSNLSISLETSFITWNLSQARYSNLISVSGEHFSVESWWHIYMYNTKSKDDLHAIYIVLRATVIAEATKPLDDLVGRPVVCCQSRWPTKYTRSRAHVKGGSGKVRREYTRRIVPRIGQKRGMCCDSERWILLGGD